jgi:antitoxin ParD1/3/4
MVLKTSISLDAHFQAFIEQQVQSGRYATASEVVRDALRRMEDDALKEREVNARLDRSLASGLSPRSKEEIFESALAVARGDKKKRAR